MPSRQSSISCAKDCSDAAMRSARKSGSAAGSSRAARGRAGHRLARRSAQHSATGRASATRSSAFSNTIKPLSSSSSVMFTGRSMRIFQSSTADQIAGLLKRVRTTAPPSLEPSKGMRACGAHPRGQDRPPAAIAGSASSRRSKRAPSSAMRPRPRALALQSLDDASADHRARCRRRRCRRSSRLRVVGPGVEHALGLPQAAASTNSSRPRVRARTARRCGRGSAPRPPRPRFPPACGVPRLREELGRRGSGLRPG